MPFVGGFLRILGTFIGGVWAGTSGGSGLDTTLISGAGMIVIGSVGGDVGTTLSSKLGMVRVKHDLGGSVDWRRIWATWMNKFLIVEL